MKFSRTILSVFAALPMIVQAAERPNFLFLLVDDMGLMDIAIEGSTFYETPNIDALAKSGVRFTQGYANCQVCSPSRASIMLGQYTATHGITDWIGAKSGKAWKRNNKLDPAEYRHAMDKESVTVAEALHGAGYKTFFAGKWHLGNTGNDPEDHGFEINVGGHHRGSPPGGFFSPYNNPKMESGPDGESLTLRLANETAQFMSAHKDEPFLAFLSFYTLHAPIQTTEELWKKYRDKAQKMGITDTKFKFDRTQPVRQVQNNPIYAGMVETLDDAVGIVMDSLKANGLDKNTVVIFTGDNGGVSSGDAYPTSLLPLRGGKGRQWEGGIREPYYIVAPQHAKAGSTNDTPVMGADFYPTILELAQVKPAADHQIDGVSLVPLLKGEKLDERELFWHYPHYGNQGGEPSSIIRSGDWKLIYYYEDQRRELYNITSDQAEQHDVAAQNPELAATLNEKLQKWLVDSGAVLPTLDSDFDPAKKAKELENQRTRGRVGLEKRHNQYLNPGFQGPKNWWGSSVPND